MMEENCEGHSESEVNGSLQSFNLPNIKCALEELLKEQKALEIELEDLIKTRKEYEEQLNKANAKYSKTVDAHGRKLDTFVMSKYKADQMDIENKRLEKRNEFLRREIEELQSKNKEEKEQHIKYIDHFEECTKELCGCFINAVTAYTEEGLRATIDEAKKIVDGVQEKIQKAEEELSSVNAEFKDFSECQPMYSQWENDIPLDQRRLTVNLFQDEKSAALRALHKIKAEEMELQQKIQRL